MLGVVVGAIKPPNPMLMERRISTTSFQPPNFKTKKYLADAAKIADEIISVMQPDNETCIKVSSQYVLSSVISHLEKKGFNVQKVESTGDLAPMVKNAYSRWCIEKGVPKELLQNQKRFWSFLEWIAERPNLREGLVKTGWVSWETKWRTEIYQKNQAMKTKQ